MDVARVRARLLEMAEELDRLEDDLAEEDCFVAGMISSAATLLAAAEDELGQPEVPSGKFEVPKA